MTSELRHGNHRVDLELLFAPKSKRYLTDREDLSKGRRSQSDGASTGQI